MALDRGLDALDVELGALAEGARVGLVREDLRVAALGADAVVLEQPEADGAAGHVLELRRLGVESSPKGELNALRHRRLVAAALRLDRREDGREVELGAVEAAVGVLRPPRRRPIELDPLVEQRTRDDHGVVGDLAAQLVARGTRRDLNEVRVAQRLEVLDVRAQRALRADDDVLAEPHLQELRLGDLFELDVGE